MEKDFFEGLSNVLIAIALFLLLGIGVLFLAPIGMGLIQLLRTL